MLKSVGNAWGWNHPRPSQERTCFEKGEAGPEVPTPPRETKVGQVVCLVTREGGRKTQWRCVDGEKCPRKTVFPNAVLFEFLISVYLLLRRGAEPHWAPHCSAGGCRPGMAISTCKKNQAAATIQSIGM